MDEIQENANSNHVVEEEGLMTVDNQANDEEWNQFIQRELEKQNNQEGNKESLSGKDDILNSIMEKIPVEDLINATINAIKEKVDTEIKKRKKKKKQTIEQKDPIGQIKKNEDTNNQKTDRSIKNKNQIYKTRQKERRRELYRKIYG
ncbi:hypothetical protein [Gracilibacillus suaedae]|uniref:hypothetical protein n=1 Tax=Gracilibacillus suaedae TaxID=2820273 RepID=UPI001ABDF2A1|nr:hypothetical protein [Gracilibacillus suaedae]